MAIVADRDLALIYQISMEVRGTVTHKVHGEECNCEKRMEAAFNATVRLVFNFRDTGNHSEIRPPFVQMGIELIGKEIRRALLPESLDMFLEQYSGVDVEPLPPMAFMTGQEESSSGHG